MEDGKTRSLSDGISVASDAHQSPTNEGEHTKEVVVSQSIDEADQNAPASTTDAEEKYLTGMKLMLVMVAISMTCFLLLLDMSIVSTAVPKITSDFHSLPDIGWYGSAYLLANCALQPMAGKLYSQFDSKFTYMAYFALFELGSLLTGVATSSNMFIVGRAVSGMGGSGLFNGGLTIIATIIPLEKRAVYMGALMGLSQLGVLFGPLLGGALTEHVSWRWCFYINLPAGAFVAVFLFFVRIPSNHTKTSDKFSLRSTLKSLDLIGFTLFSPAAIMFLLALQWGGNEYKWGSPTIIGLFCGAGAIIAIFCVWEHIRGDTAMIPPSMIKKRVVISSCMVQLFQFGCMLVTSYYLSIYFQAVRGITPTLSGVYQLPTILSQMLLGILSGFAVNRVGYYLPFIILSTILGTIGTGLMSTLNSTSTTGAWVGYQIIAGVGRGSGLQMPLLAIQNNLKPHEIPVGTSLAIFFQTIGGALFLSFSQTVFSTTLVDALPKFAPEVDVPTVISAGATGVRDIVLKVLLPGVLLAYTQAINHVFYLGTGAIGGAFFFSLGMGWKSVKKAKVVAPEA